MTQFEIGDRVLFSIDDKLHSGIVKCIDGDKVEIDEKTVKKFGFK